VFDSPWGKGRPGWHIECSAMSSKYLGNDFDIHGGGADLMFPHHENEIAQSCCAHPGTGYAKVWVHNGFLTVNGEKMSKSLGNFITVRDLLDKGVRGEVIRYAFLKTKYNEPLDWNDKLLSDAKKELDYFYRALSGYKPLDKEIIFEGEELDILQDDLNTPALLRELHGIASDIHNKNVNDNQNSISQRQWKMKKIGELLGLFTVTSEEWAKGTTFHIGAESGSYKMTGGDVKLTHVMTDEGIDARITARTTAKNSKNWKEADRIRDELKAQGIILEDKPDGTTDWRRA
jgi:cysteinyl-tRNA synthetase